MSERNWEEIIHGTLPEIIKATGEWRRSRGFDTGWANFSEKLMLIITEIDEARSARVNIQDAMDRFIGNQSDFDGQMEALGVIGEALRNYHEEWADTMVRIFDLCDACDLSIGLSEHVGGVQGLKVVIGWKGMERGEECMHCISETMEAFRHVELKRIPDGANAPLRPAEGEHLDAVVEWLGGAASVAAWAMADLGEDWRRHYMLAMQKNEKRPYKHGKQR